MFRKGAAMLTFACAAVYSAAGVIVTPGSAFVLPEEEIETLIGDLLAFRSESFAIENALSEVRATGTATSAVYEALGGGLYFLYQVENDASSLDELNRIAVTNFDGFVVEAGQDVVNGVGPQKAKSVDRSAAGGTIGFAFTEEPIGLGNIAPGEGSETMWLYVDTSVYRDGTLSIIDGGVDTVLSYAPGVVPEPASLAALSIGAAALLRRRRK